MDFLERLTLKEIYCRRKTHTYIDYTISRSEQINLLAHNSCVSSLKETVEKCATDSSMVFERSDKYQHAFN